MTNGQSAVQKHAALREGSEDEGRALYSTVRELLAARERFGEHIERVEKTLDMNGRMKEIAKLYSHFVEQARLELDAPINADGAPERAKEGRIADAKRLLQLALRGGLGESRANEIQREIAHAEYLTLVKAWEQDLLQRAPGLNGMSTVNRYKERIAQKNRSMAINDCRVIWRGS